MSKVLEGVTAKIVKIDNDSMVQTECPENFNMLSDCFAALVFGDVDPAAGTIVSRSQYLNAGITDRTSELYFSRRLGTRPG